MSTKLRLLAILAAAVIGLTGCGEDTADGGGDEGEAEGAALAIEAYDFGFEAEGDALPEGGDVTVTLVNEGEEPHTFTSEEVDLDVEATPGGEAEGTFTMPESGSVEFLCTFHPDQMRLTLTAGEAPAAEGDTGGSESEDKKEDDTGTGTDDTDY